MINPKSYWKALVVNIENIQEDWDQGKNHSRKLKLYLFSLEPDVREHIIQFILPHNGYGSDIADKDYDHILRQENAKHFQALKEFYMGKHSVIDEYVANNAGKFSIIEKKNTILALIKIFKTKPNLLMGLLLMKVWISRNTDETFIYTPVISEGQIKLVIGDIHNVISSIRRKSKGKYEFKSYHQSGDNNIFWIEKQNNDQMMRAFSKNIRFKPASDIMFNINLKEHILEIKCSNKTILNALADTIARRLSIKLFYPGGEEPPVINLKKFERALTTTPVDPEKDNLGICEALINRLNLDHSSPILIPKRSGRDIRETINELNEAEIITLNDLSCFDHIKIIYNDMDLRIKFNRNKDGTLTLQLDDRFLSRPKLKELMTLFESQFGIPLGKEIMVDEKKVLESTYTIILSSTIIDKVSETIKDNLDKLHNKGIISYSANKVYWCNMCKRTFSEVEKCPQCQEDLRHSVSKVKVQRKSKEILTYLKKRLDSAGFSTGTSLRSRTYLGHKRQFVNVLTNRTSIYLYFNDGKDVKNMIEYFKHSHIPIIVVNTSNKKIKGFDPEVFPQLNLAKLLVMQDEEFTDYFKRTIDKIQDKIEDIIISAANNSAKRLGGYLEGNSVGYDSGTLEDDSYNLLRYVFRTGEKWGKFASGKTVPEGIIGYGFLKKTGSQWKTFLRSIIWDCKFTEGKEFDFGRYAKIQARDYVVRASQIKAIKDFSKQLSAYISFTNKANPTQYNNFAKKLKNIEDWNGYVVLFQLDALVTLYKLFKKHFTELDKRRSQLYAKLNRMLSQTEKDQNYTLITEDKIKVAVNEVLQMKEDIPQLDYKSTFLRLVADKIRIRG